MFELGEALSGKCFSMFHSEALWCYYFRLFEFFVALVGISKARELLNFKTYVKATKGPENQRIRQDSLTVRYCNTGCENMQS